MKLVEMKCPYCGGQVNLEKLQNNVVICEYCGNQFMVDDEKQQNITNYNIYQYGTKKDEQQSNRQLVWGLCIGGVMLAALIGIAVIGSLSSRTATGGVYYPEDVYVYDALPEAEEVQEESDTRSGLYAAIVEAVFEKPFSDVSGQEIQKIKYLKVHNSLENSEIWYSFDDPYGAEEPEVIQKTLPRQEWQAEDLNYFPGLIKVDAGYSLSETSGLKELKNLRGLACTKLGLQDIADMVADPALLIELNIGDVDSLEGIGQFKNLEILTMKDVEGNDLKLLIPLKKLYSLSIEDGMEDGSADIRSGETVTRIKDYSAISVMTQLKSLALSSDVIRDIGFIRGLPELTSLTLEDTGIISLEPLAGTQGLTSLAIIDNKELQDFSALENLTALQELSVAKMSSQPEPGLSNLTRLQKLDISGFTSLSFLKALPQLKELSVHNCNVDDTDAFASLTNVEKLTFYSVWNSNGKPGSLDFLSAMTGLKYADFTGDVYGNVGIGFQSSIEVYGDVSAVFNLPRLEELYLNGGSFEVKFDKIKENTSLKVLGMENLTLHNNYYVESYGGLTSVWYDDVKLDEHTDFLLKFPDLEELYLGRNQLTQVNFAAGLKKLVRLDIKDNYVTDLSPLVQAEALEYLNIADNPAGGTEGMDGEIEIVR